jgi:hypothetical protein
LDEGITKIRPALDYSLVRHYFGSAYEIPKKPHMHVRKIKMRVLALGLGEKITKDS